MSLDDGYEIDQDAKIILKLTCTLRCVKRDGFTGTNKDFVCRKLNNFKVSPDNTGHCIIPLRNKRSPIVVKILQETGLFEAIQINDYGHVSQYKSNHPFFYRCRYIPRTHGFDDINMSSVEKKLFAASRSMQNIQSSHCTNGVNKYVCKYCAKLDQQS